MKAVTFVSPLSISAVRPAPTLRPNNALLRLVRTSPVVRRATIRSARACAVTPTRSQTYSSTVEPVAQFLFTPDDGLSFHERAHKLAADGLLPKAVAQTLTSWYGSYQQAVTDHADFPFDPSVYTEQMFTTLLELSRRGVEQPIQFNSFHERIRAPFDYYKFSVEFASVLLNKQRSTVTGMDNVRRVVEYVRNGDNVVFLSNHQSEGDPFAIDVLFEHIAKCDRTFCEQIIFMAGDRVRDDPVVMPFSAGRNLFTVYSKKHINDVPELREYKTLHNKRTLAEAQRMFSEGGCAVWLAPSGGRDRRSAETGRVEVSPFDGSSIDMMRYTAAKSNKPCHFFPMSLLTYNMLPPPTKVGGAEVGEERVANHIPMHMYVADEIDWERIVPPQIENKLDRRKAQREYVENVVKSGYEAIGGYEQ